MTETFAKPFPITALDVAFPTASVLSALLPAMEAIPTYYPGCTSFRKVQQKWFFKGLEEKDLPRPKPGIDRDVAIRHLQCIQGSFAPKHEHKVAAVAWLMSLWFEIPVVA